MVENKFHAKKQFELNGKTYNYYELKSLEKAGYGEISRLPFSVRVLLESVLRQYDGHVIKDEHVEGLTKRSEEHTSELQSRGHLVCRLLLEKKKKKKINAKHHNTKKYTTKYKS